MAIGTGDRAATRLPCEQGLPGPPEEWVMRRGAGTSSAAEEAGGDAMALPGRSRESTS